MLRVAKLVEDAKLPTRKHPKDAGLDVYSLEDCFIEYGKMTILRTGITVSIPNGYHIQIWPKSRSNFLIGGGIVDEEYTGEILVKIFNLGAHLSIKRGDAIAQMVLVPVDTPQVLETSLERIHLKTLGRKTDGITLQREAQIIEELGYPPTPKAVNLEIQDLNITQS